MTGFPLAPRQHGDPAEHRRKIAEATNRALGGKLNATLGVTLAANAATTTVSDPRISAASFIGFCPLHADAAAELAGGTLYVSAQTSGELTLAHANDASTDRAFRLLVIG